MQVLAEEQARRLAVNVADVERARRLMECAMEVSSYTAEQREQREQRAPHRRGAA